jgi:hypothetical protein
LDQGQPDPTLPFWSSSSLELIQELESLLVLFRDNSFKLGYEKSRNKFKPDEIVGNLEDLFRKYTELKDKRISNKWIEDQRKSFEQKLKK